MRLSYLRDPERIYRESFATVEREADLSGFTRVEARIAARIIHACGMPDIARDLRLSPGAAPAAARALAAGAAIICDCSMVEAGLSPPGPRTANPILCLIGDPSVQAQAARERTTRSAAQVPFWRPHQAGAVVVIGNAPTALFRLIEEIRAGAPMPAAVLGFPVGFVGAAEAKQALVDADPPIPHIALLGRRGGSAMAAAAVNALARIDGRGPE